MDSIYGRPVPVIIATGGHITHTLDYVNVHALATPSGAPSLAPGIQIDAIGTTSGRLDVGLHITPNILFAMISDVGSINATIPDTVGATLHCSIAIFANDESEWLSGSCEPLKTALVSMTNARVCY